MNSNNVLHENSSPIETYWRIQRVSGSTGFIANWGKQIVSELEETK